MKKKVLILFSLIVCLAGFANAQTSQPVTLRFEQCPATSNVACTQDIATFTGGYATVTNDPYCQTQGKLYWSASDSSCSGCNPIIKVAFATEVSDVKFSVNNGWPHGVQRVLAWSDNGSESAVFIPRFQTTFFVPPNEKHWRQMVMPGGNFREITVSGMVFNGCVTGSGPCYTNYWNYAIDDLIYTKTPSDTRIVFGTRGIPGMGDPFVKNLPRINQIEASYPIGAHFFARLERWEDDQWVPIPARSELSNEAITDKNDVEARALYPTHPVIAYNANASEEEKLFQGIHYGTAILTLITNDSKFSRVSMKVTVNPAARLGLGQYVDNHGATQNVNYDYDATILKRAHSTGIPPQWIKAQIEQEANFNPTAYRYELRTRDWEMLQSSTHPYSLGNVNSPFPFRRYKMGDGPELCNPTRVPGVPFNDCAFTDLDDISPRERYRILGANGQPRNITRNDGVVTIRQIVQADNGRYNWFSAPPVAPKPRGRRRAVAPPDPLKVPAQTTVASSYGLLQLVYTDIIDRPFRWSGIDSRFNPTLLFDTAANHDRGGGSLVIGTKIALLKWGRANPDPVHPAYSAPADFAADLREMYIEYNGRSGYGGEVEARIDHYTPIPSTVITAPLCEHQEFTAQSRDTQIASGDTAVLGVAIDADDVQYQWFSGSKENVIPGATTQSLEVRSPGTYWCRAKTECGFVWSDPIVVSTAPSCTAPTIQVQPKKEKTILEGMTTSFGAEVTGTGLRYQWYQGNPTAPSSAIGGFNPPKAVPLVDENAPTITVQPKTTTTYFLYIENSCGAAISDVVTVVVERCEPVTIGTQSIPVTITRGESTVLSITPEGTAPFTIQWYTGTPTAAVAIEGERGTELTVTPNTSTSCFAAVTNRCGSTSSTPVLITVTESCVTPSIAAQSASNTITRGESTTLSITPSGSTPRTIRWFAGTAAITGANGTTYEVSPTSTTTYRAVVTNDCGEATTAPIVITVVEACGPATISSQSSSVTIVRGQSTRLSIVPAGSSPRTIQWYTGTPGPGSSLPVIGANASTLDVAPTATVSYFAVVTNDCGSATSTPITVTVTTECVSPTVASQPSGKSITAGQSATLSMTASGTSPLSYQWFSVNPSVLVGTSATLTVSPTQTTSYYCVVSNACGNAQSATVTVNVCLPPAITQPPASSTIVAGQSTTLFVTASGSTPLSYTWYTAAGTVVSNSRTPSVSPAQTTSYYVVVSNSCGSATSAPVTVTVSAACTHVSIVQQPQGGTIDPGDPFTLYAAANGTQPITYRWYGDGSFIAEGQEILVTPSQTTSYSVKVSNACSSDVSVTVVVEVLSCQPASITQGPQDQSITAGQSTMLSVSASGTQPRLYQWFANGVSVGTGSSISVSPSQTTTYTVRVENACGVDTAQATVSVCQPVRIVSQMPGGTVTAGTNISLSVDAIGTDPFTYQWFANGSLISTSPSVTVTPTGTTTYTARVENSCGFDTTSTVFMVCTPPSITAEPQDATITAGQSATLAVGASGSDPRFEWFTTGGTYVGSGMSISVTPSATTSYYARVSNDCGTVSSAVATVTVSCVPVIIEQPHWIGPQLLKVTAAGSNLHYSWSYLSPFADWAVWGGDSDTVETFPSLFPIYWRVVVTNDCGSVESEWFYIVP